MANDLARTRGWIECDRQLTAPITLRLEPPFDDRHDIVDLLGLKRAALGDAVPFGQAAAAAGGRGVLGHEDRMSTHGSLLAVILRSGGSQSFSSHAPLKTAASR